MEQQILERIVELFVVPTRKQRLLGFLRSKKRYPQFLDELLHDARHIDSSVLYKVPSTYRDVDHIAAILRSAGVQGDGYIVGSSHTIEDGTAGEFYELLKHCCGSMTDCLVFSTKSEIAYYEGHEGFGYIYGLPVKFRILGAK